jgi:signal peptide peptidase SppA
VPKKVTRRYRSIVRAVHETLWAIRPEKLETIASFLARRSAGESLSRAEIQAALSGRPQPVETQSKKVALINVMGTICPRLSLMEDISGGVSCEALGRSIDKATASADVGTIVLNFDTPGGNVFGVEEVAAKIFAAREKKRVIGVANFEAASAGFWLLAACSEVVAAPSAWVGSIGVLSIHYSTAGWEAKEGYQTTITRRPAAKAEGAAGESLSEEAKVHRQQLVDKRYEQFVADVARFRKVTTAKVESSFGAGRMVLADEALAAGMIDRIATLEQVLSELGVSAKASGSTSEPAFPLEGLNMDPKLFGALVRIGMCPITASTEEANAALARFFAAQGQEPPATIAEQVTALEAFIKKPPANPASPPVNLPASQQQPRAAGDDDRAADITAAVRLASNIPAARQIELVSELLAAKGADGMPLSVQAAVKRIQTVAAEHATKQSPGATTIQGTGAERDKFTAAARDALLGRIMTSRPKQIFDRRAGEYVDYKPAAGGRRLGSLIGLGEECLIVAGFDSRQVRDLPKATIARLMVGGHPGDYGLSASSDGPAFNVSGMFSNILLDAAHVTLRRSYDDARTTFQVWMKKAPNLEDFKLAHAAIAGELGDPKAIPEDGEFEETTFTDAKEKWQLTVWGHVFSLTWQAIANDSLGAYGEVPGKMGGSMKRKQNRLAYGVLKDNPTMADTGALFNATAQTTAGGHNNLSTGAGTPTVANLNTLTKRMMEMRGLNTSEGAALNIMPRYILGPPALRGTILELLGSISNPAGTHAGVKNIWENGLEPVIEGELGAAATGGSDTAWYTAADHNECEHLSYTYLDGMETPVIEQEAAFDRLAVRTRIYQAFAVHPFDFRGIQKHAGA